MRKLAKRASILPKNLKILPSSPLLGTNRPIPRKNQYHRDTNPKRKINQGEGI